MSQEAPRNPSPQEGEQRSPRNFMRDLELRQTKTDSLLCLGMDPDPLRMPDIIIPKDVKNLLPTLDINSDPHDVVGLITEGILRFNTGMLDATQEDLSAIKPNTAFYEAFGTKGLDVLKKTIEYANEKYPDLPVILDGKRTDIANTNEQYAKMAFDWLKADALTVNPWFGGESLEPFLKRTNKGVIILCRTSNPGAPDIQDLVVDNAEIGLATIYEIVAHLAQTKWNKNGNVCLVVGATYPDQLARVRGRFFGPILVPGLGAQGGKPEDLPYGLDNNKRGIIANNARQILYKSSGPDYLEAAAAEAHRWKNAINEVRKAA